MRFKWFAAIVAAGCSVASTTAFAQDSEAAPERWSVTVTPRFQQLLFQPSFNADSLEGMSSFGGSVAVRNPDGRFGLMATYMTGEASGTYTFDDEDFSADYDYDASREEIALTGEFTPRDTNVTFLLGYHRFDAGNVESRIDAAAGDFENNRQNFSIDAVEAGVRFSSALGRDSRHSLSAQFMFGIGAGKADVTLSERLNAVTENRIIDEEGTGYLADVALGYNFFITNNFSLGLRGRAYAFYVDVDADDVDPILALAPEVNFSFRF